MAIATQGTASNYLQRAPSPSGLADVVDLILDKGLVIDAYVRVAVIGIELVTIDARIVIASVDTYLRFAEQVNRLDLTQTEAAGLEELRDGGGSKGEGQGEGRCRRRQGEGRRARTATVATTDDGSATVTEAPAYVYGVTWADGPPTADVRRRRCDAVGAGGRARRARRARLASCRRPTSVPGGATCSRHADVLQQAFERRTVVPLGFGTVFDSDDDVVAELLEPRYEELVALAAATRRARRADRAGLLRRGRSCSPRSSGTSRGSPRCAARPARREQVALGEAVAARTRATAGTATRTRSSRRCRRSPGRSSSRSAWPSSKWCAPRFSSSGPASTSSTRRPRSSRSSYGGVDPLQAHRAAATPPLRVGAMGFLTGLLLLPLAPLRGTIWLAERLTEVAERELDSEATLRRLLVEAEIAFDSGELSRERVRAGRGRAPRAARAARAGARRA